MSIWGDKNEPLAVHTAAVHFSDDLIMVFDVSRRIGVSPWHWWPDVKPIHQVEVTIADLPVVQGPPSVK